LSNTIEVLERKKPEDILDILLTVPCITSEDRIEE
jgi:hypothetical protein